MSVKTKPEKQCGPLHSGSFTNKLPPTKIQLKEFLKKLEEEERNSRRGLPLAYKLT